MFIYLWLFFFVCSAAFAETAVCFQDQCFTVETAGTFEEQSQGLQFRTELAPDAGMLFIFSHDGRYAFWMKDTLIPLDMIWLDRDMKVVHMKENVPPCTHDPCPSYSPESPARYVLELNAGMVQKIGLKIDDVMRRVISHKP